MAAQDPFCNGAATWKCHSENRPQRTAPAVMSGCWMVAQVGRFPQGHVQSATTNGPAYRTALLHQHPSAACAEPGQPGERQEAPTDTRAVPWRRTQDRVRADRLANAGTRCISPRDMHQAHSMPLVEAWRQAATRRLRSVYACALLHTSDAARSAGAPGGQGHGACSPLHQRRVTGSNCSWVTGGPKKSTVGVNWVQLERAPVLRCPALVWISQVDDVRDAARGDDVIMAQQVAALGVAVARAVCFIDQGALWQPCDLHGGRRVHGGPLYALASGFAWTSLTQGLHRMKTGSGDTSDASCHGAGCLCWNDFRGAHRCRHAW